MPLKNERGHISEKMLTTVKNNLFRFIALWFGVFILSFLLLSLFGLVPDSDPDISGSDLDSKKLDIEDLEEKLIAISPSLPKRVVVDEIGVDVRVNNPESQSISVLDDSLLSGAVRYPSSGLLGEKTNMLLFGHNSSLPVVRNQNFKAFNKLDKLKKGDGISIFSSTHEFVYSVKSVEEADAENALVVFESEKREITLSTCNTFGDLNDRFVVRADLVDVRTISSSN